MSKRIGFSSTESLSEKLDPKILALPIEETGIPHVSLTGYFSTNRIEWIEKVSAFWRIYGFISVQDESINSDTLRYAYNAAIRFFQLPDDVKGLYTRDLEYGFTGRGGEKAAGEKLPDDKEFFHIHHGHYAKKDVFPKEVPHFEPSVTAWYKIMLEQSGIMLKIFSYGLGLNSNILQRQLGDGPSVMRLLHYFNDQQFLERPLAAGHDDINLITGLPPHIGRGSDKGLWCLGHDGEKVWVQNLKVFRIIWNFGNMASMFCNGLYRDVFHGVERGIDLQPDSFSMPFFVHVNRAPNDDFPLVTLTSLQNGIYHYTGKNIVLPPEFQTGNILTCGQFFRHRIQEIDTKLEDPKYDQTVNSLGQLRQYLNEAGIDDSQLNQIPLFGRGWLPETFPLKSEE